METSHITIRIPTELHERLRVMAALKSKSVNSLIVELLDQGAPQDEIKEMVEAKFPDK